MQTQPAGPRAGSAPRRPSIVWPTILIGLGLVFLLQNLGVLPVGIWGSIWRLWPVVLVLVGLEMILGSRGSPLLTVLVVGLALILSGIVLVGAWGAVPFTQRGAAPQLGFQGQTFSQDLQGAQRADVVVKYGAGQMNLGPLTGADGNTLSTMTFDGPPGMEPQPSYSVAGGVGRLEYSQEGNMGPWMFRGSGTPSMEVTLTRNVPLSLNVATGAGSSRIDLQDLQVGRLDFSVGAAEAWIRLPAHAGNTTARISGGAASISVEVPRDVALQVRYQGGLSSVQIDPEFASVGGGLYRSPDYDRAQNRVDLTIEAGAASVSVRRSPLVGA